MGKGNVCVIYDPDERYAKRLMGIINDDKDIPYKARMFTRKEEFNKYIAGNDTDVLMVNEECYTYEIQKKSNNNVIVLCEEENEARRINDRKKEGHTGVCKYQPAYQLLGTISKKHTETEQNEKEKSFKCIGVYGFNSSLKYIQTRKNGFLIVHARTKKEQGRGAGNRQPRPCSLWAIPRRSR